MKVTLYKLPNADNPELRPSTNTTDKNLKVCSRLFPDLFNGISINTAIFVVLAGTP
jgi:hypothetical protein